MTLSPHHRHDARCRDCLVTGDEGGAELQCFSHDQPIMNIRQCGQRLDTDGNFWCQRGKTKPGFRSESGIYSSPSRMRDCFSTPCSHNRLAQATSSSVSAASSGNAP